MPRIGGQIIGGAHHAIHEDGGADEISIAGLSGTPAALTTHEADLDAHVRSLFEIVRLNSYISSPYRIGYDAGTHTLVANRLYALPYLITRDRTPSHIAIDVETADASNSNLRLGLYADDGTIYPGARITNGGVVDVSSTGTKAVAYTTKLVKGLIWVVFIADGTPVLYKTTYHISVLGHTSVARGYHHHWYKNGTYGDLPTTFPSGGTTGEAVIITAMKFTSND